MSGGNIDELLRILAGLYPENDPPASKHDELYAMIDAIKDGDVAWDSFTIKYNGERPTESVPPWMNQSFQVWFRDPLQVLENQLANPDFKHHIDYAPKRVFRNGKREYKDLMSGDWSWKQAVRD